MKAHMMRQAEASDLADMADRLSLSRYFGSTCAESLVHQCVVAAPKRMPSWDLFKTFKLEHTRQATIWAPIQEMVSAATASMEPALHVFTELRDKWNSQLKSLGGDSSSTDFSEFRPLRLSREEDWSDWLGWLLRTSRSGILANELFGEVVQPDQSFAEVLRELTCAAIGDNGQTRRVDLMLTWQINSAAVGISIEVKLWDQNFEKTFDAAAQLQKTAPRDEWHHFILIPDESLPAWNDVSATYTGKVQVGTILWRDVIRGIRRTLWNEQESVAWRVWAWTFCGAIEKTVLRLKMPHTYSCVVSQFSAVLRWIQVLQLDRHENMADELTPFLEQGIKHFAEARDVISRFEEEMHRFIDDWAKNRRSWAPIENISLKKAVTGGSRDGHWICKTAKGTLQKGEQVEIDCGLWWNCTDAAEPIVYASFIDTPARVLGFRWHADDPSIKSFQRWNRTFLYVPFRRVEDVQTGLEVLIATLLKQL